MHILFYFKKQKIKIAFLTPYRTRTEARIIIDGPNKERKKKEKANDSKFGSLEVSKEEEYSATSSHLP